MKTIQIHSFHEGAKQLLTMAGITRMHKGWYTLTYNGVALDPSTVVSAKYNYRGMIKE